MESQVIEKCKSECENEEKQQILQHCWNHQLCNSCGLIFIVDGKENFWGFKHIAC